MSAPAEPYAAISLHNDDGTVIEEEWAPGPFGVPRVGDTIWSNLAANDIVYEVTTVQWSTDGRFVGIVANEVEE